MTSCPCQVEILDQQVDAVAQVFVVRVIDIQGDLGIIALERVIATMVFLPEAAMGYAN